MNITLIGPVYPYRGGIAHYNASLARALTAADHTVRLISFRRQYPSLLYPGESDKDPSAQPLAFPADYILDPLYPWTWLHAARIIRVDRPDLVLFHWWTTFWAPAYTGLAWLIRRRVKTAFLIHNVLPHEAKAWDRWLARTTLHQARIFIVQAPHEREKLSRLIAAASQVIATPHPAYRPFSEEPVAKVAARQQLELPVNRPVLLFFGIVRPYKGLKYLVEALSHVTQPVHLVIAGEFWEDVTIYRQQIEALKLVDKITLLDRYIPNEEAHLLFSAADALVAPYIGGTQSGAAGLALGYGLPMIITDRVAAGLPAEMEKQSPTGGTIANDGYTKVVPPADPLALAQAVDALVEALSTLSLRDIPAPGNDWSRLVGIIENIGQEKP
jgi:glycosyltransferase involved in cell wall biosynthesis